MSLSSNPPSPGFGGQSTPPVESTPHRSGDQAQRDQAPGDYGSSNYSEAILTPHAYVREHQFEALFEGALDAVLVADNERRYVDANAAACTLLGLSRAELLGRHIDDFAPPEARSLIAHNWQQFLTEGEQRGELSLCRADGESREVEYSARANFTPGFHLSILRDFTERKAVESKLRESEAKLRSLVEAIPQQIWTARPDGALDYVSPRVLEYTGSSYDELIGHGWQHILHPDDIAVCVERWTQALRTGNPYEIEFRLRRASDGCYRWHLGRALPVLDDDGQVTKWFGTNTDITEQKQLEAARANLLADEQEARAQAEAANRAKDEFLAFLAHEMRTPLASMLGWAHLLKQEQVEPTVVTQGLESIERGADALSKMTEEMLDVSRIILGRLNMEKTPLELAPLVEAAVASVRPAAEEKGVHLEAHLAASGEIVFGDAYRLQQVLWNLLSNAIKFTPTGGHIGVHLRQVDAQMEIRVSDTGHGVSAEFLPHVFERLQQEPAGLRTSPQRFDSGLGLGLSIVYNLVEAHGGTVRAESPGRGQGSSFYVYLPIVELSGRELPASDSS